MILVVITPEMACIYIGHQVHRASLCALDVETFYCIRLEQLLYAVLFAMQSQRCHLLVRCFILLRRLNTPATFYQLEVQFSFEFLQCLLA